MWVHLFDPHAPYRPPPPFDAQYAGRPYYGEVADDGRGACAAARRSRAQRTPTLVVVTADHGEALGDHGEQSHGLFAYESTLRVPLILAQHIPGEEAPERTEGSSVPVRHVDLLPTMLSAVGCLLRQDRQAARCCLARTPRLRVFDVLFRGDVRVLEPWMGTPAGHPCRDGRSLSPCR